jgi:hypothetical protein
MEMKMWFYCHALMPVPVPIGKAASKAASLKASVLRFK